MPLLTLFPILGFALLLFLCFRKHAELAVFSSICLITLVLYFAALAGALRPAAYGVFALGCLALPAALLAAKGRFKETLKNFFRPGVVIFILASCVHWALFQDNMAYYWDEFSHWALAPKEMYYRDAIYTGVSNVLFKHYPPALALWQYFVVKIFGFREGALFFAHFMFLFAPFTIMYRRVRWKQWYLIIAIFVLQIAFLGNLGHGVRSLLVDHVLSACFVGVLLASLSDDFKGWDVALFLPLLAVLPLVKEVGMYLAICAALFVFLHQFWIRKDASVSWGALFQKDKVRVLLLVLVLAAPFLGWGSWQGHLSATGHAESSPPLDAGLFTSLGEIVSSSDQDDSRTEAKKRFWETFTSLPMSKTSFSFGLNESTYSSLQKYPEKYRLSTRGWTILSLLFFAALAVAFQGKKRRETLFTAGFMFMFFALYVVMLLYLYLFIFNDYQALNVVSYVRYMDIGLLPLCLVSIALCLPLFQPSPEVEKNPAKSKRRLVAPALLVFMVLFTMSNERPFLWPLYANSPTPDIRYIMAPYQEIVEKKALVDAKLYIVFPIQDADPYKVAMRYLLSPARLTFSDTFILEASEKRLVHEMSKYEYVVFPVESEGVFVRYSPYFPDQPWAKPFFKVQNNQGKMTLTQHF